MANTEFDQILEFDPVQQRAIELIKEPGEELDQYIQRFDRFMDHLMDHSIEVGLDPLTGAFVVRTENVKGLHQLFDFEDITEQRNLDLANREGIKFLRKNPKYGEAIFFDYKARVFGRCSLSDHVEIYPDPRIANSPQLTQFDNPRDWLQDDVRYSSMDAALANLREGYNAVKIREMLVPESKGIYFDPRSLKI